MTMKMTELSLRQLLTQARTEAERSGGERRRGDEWLMAPLVVGFKAESPEGLGYMGMGPDGEEGALVATVVLRVVHQVRGASSVAVFLVEIAVGEMKYLDLARLDELMYVLACARHFAGRLEALVRGTAWDKNHIQAMLKEERLAVAAPKGPEV